MAKDAILGANLVDGLVPTVDELRASLHDAFGVRQYHVYTVLRTWDGGATGKGTANDVETELVPKPRVDFFAYQGVPGARYELDECGIDEVGMIRLREISLEYSEAELNGPPALAAGQEWLIKITDAQGQLMRDSHWVVAKPAKPDRTLDIGWTMELRLT